MKQNENCIMLSDGWILYDDGTLQENSASGYGTIKKPDNEFERSRLIVIYWQKKLELCVAEFDDKKATWLAAARNRLGKKGNPGGPPADTTEAVALLTALKAKVHHCQEMLSEAEQNLERNTPTQLRKNIDIAEQNRARIADFVGSIEKIEI